MNLIFALTLTVPTSALQLLVADSQTESCGRPSILALQKGGLPIRGAESLTNSSLYKILDENAWHNEGMLKQGRSSVSQGYANRECELPKILHFLWMGSQLKPHLANNIATFGRLNPQHDIYLWTEQELAGNVTGVLSGAMGSRFKVKKIKDEVHNFRNRELMCSMDNYAGKSDVLRLEVVYLHGGIYLDADTVPFRGFHEYGELFRWPFTTFQTKSQSCNCIFGFAKKSGFLDFALDAVHENCAQWGECEVMNAAGTGAFQAALVAHNSSDVTLIPQNFMAHGDLNPKSENSELDPNRITAAGMEGSQKGGWYKDFYVNGRKQAPVDTVGFCKSTKSFRFISSKAKAAQNTEYEKEKVRKALYGLIHN